MIMTKRWICTIWALWLTAGSGAILHSAPRFAGRFFRGEGDVDYLQLLDISRRMFAVDPEFQHVGMLYQPAWNGFVEGPRWNAWWVQNSYGPTYCALPFYMEPYITFLQNAQDLWFDQMGNGKRTAKFKDHTWTAPDGALMDCASPGSVIYKQGDGRVAIHDWGMEFTAAGALLQAELVLIGRDREAIGHYLPKLERCANFIESRREPKLNLFLAGAAGNLLAPSYAGWKKPDGTYDKAYLTGLSVTYIAFLDRLIELEKFVGSEEKVRLYAERRKTAHEGLRHLTTEEGYLIKYLDPDGARHGEYGAKQYGYFEAVCNHDAICFRVVDDVWARKIFTKLASIPGLRPNDFVITNYPSLDDMYEDKGIFGFGTWVNGGHWSTCEARMIMAYYRLGAYVDARRSMKKLLTFAKRFQMDNPLKDFGNTPWFDRNPINLCYDSFGPPAAMIRGLFEYQYKADGLVLRPHIPGGITKLEQRFPIRWGRKRLYLSTAGQGPVTRVRINGKGYNRFDEKAVFLTYEKVPDRATIQIALGGGRIDAAVTFPKAAGKVEVAPDSISGLEKNKELVKTIQRFYELLIEKQETDTYERAHARLALECMAAIPARAALIQEGQITELPKASQEAAEQAYVKTASRHCVGLGKQLDGYAKSGEKHKQRMYGLWKQAGQ